MSFFIVVVAVLVIVAKDAAVPLVVEIVPLALHVIMAMLTTMSVKVEDKNKHYNKIIITKMVMMLIMTMTRGKYVDSGNKAHELVMPFCAKLKI